MPETSDERNPIEQQSDDVNAHLDMLGSDELVAMAREWASTLNDVLDLLATRGVFCVSVIGVAPDQGYPYDRSRVSLVLHFKAKP